MNTYIIRYGDTTVTIETKGTKFDAIDRLILALYIHYRNNNPEDLDTLMDLLNIAYESTKIMH